MELLRRKKLLEKNAFIKYGTEFKREFSLSSKEIRISFLIPLDKIKEIDFFKIRYKDIQDKDIVSDVISMRDKYLMLDNMRIIELNTGTKYASLVYVGMAEKIDKIIIDTSHRSSWISLNSNNSMYYLN